MSCIYPHPPDRVAHAADNGHLCRAGYDRLEQTLAELPALTAWVYAHLPSGGSGQDDGSKRTKGEPPIPIREGVHDLVVEIRAVLTSWSMLVSEERDLVGPANSDPSTTAAFLLAHLPWAACQPWVDDLAAEMTDLTRSAHQLAPSTPRTYRLPAPCPTCDATELHRADGADYVSCHSCGRLWTEPEYTRLVVVLAAELARTADLPEWVEAGVLTEAFGLRPGTLAVWRHRGQLQCQRRGARLLIRLVCDVPVAEEGAA